MEVEHRLCCVESFFSPQNDALRCVVVQVKPQILVFAVVNNLRKLCQIRKHRIVYSGAHEIRVVLVSQRSLIAQDLAEHNNLFALLLRHAMHELVDCTTSQQTIVREADQPGQREIATHLAAQESQAHSLFRNSFEDKALIEL